MFASVRLSHVDAQLMIEAIQSELEKADKAASIAVCDDHGELIAFLRMDGCPIAPAQIAMNKAFTAARDGRPSGDVGASLRKAGFAISSYGDLRYTEFRGGVTIVVDGQILGAVGISGISDDEEVRLATLAVQTLKS